MSVLGKKDSPDITVVETQVEAEVVTPKTTTTIIATTTEQVVIDVDALKCEKATVTGITITPPSPPILDIKPPCLEPFFPTLRNGGDTPPPEDNEQLPVQQTIFDAELTSQPLPAFDEENSNIRYPNAFKEDGSATVPEKPETGNMLSEAYMYPTLSKNERQRLTSLWYYTRSIHTDRRLLKHLQDTVDLVCDVLGHDCAILGLLDHDCYTRLVTSNVPLAVIPRREATCSHTINQKCGTVFMVPDCDADWRFKDSPHVKAGLGSYAGTQLKYKLPNSDVEVVFGSLCVASWEKKEPLTKLQQRALVRFANMIVYDVIERARLCRSSDREAMSERLSRLVKSDLTVDNVFDRSLKIMRETFPGARVSLVKSQDGILPLWNVTSSGNTNGVPYENFRRFLWEDTEAIEKDILEFNHVPGKEKQFNHSLRAVAVKLSAVEDAYLVVETNDLKHIFDEADASFVQSCGLVICNVVQEYTLRKAINAKFHFFRCVSHELRTPLHAILSTCELLIEEARAQLQASVNAPMDELLDTTFDLGSPKVIENTNSENFGVLGKVMSMLSLIDASAQTLQRVINNLLDFERLETSSQHEVLGPTGLPVPKRKATRTLELQSLSMIDEAVLSRVALGTKPAVDIILDNQLPPEIDLILTDFDLLRQCLGSVLQNALDYTESGTVTFRTSVSPDYSTITYDIIDTGIGIHENHHSRIFLPFEKASTTSRGPGLGLTIASRIASSLGGSLSLISSSPNNGSHFQLCIENAGLAAPATPRKVNAPMPLTFFVPDQEQPIPHIAYTAHHLESLGFTRTDQQHASLVLIESLHNPDDLLSVVREATERQIVIHIVSPSNLRTAGRLSPSAPKNNDPNDLFSFYDYSCGEGIPPHLGKRYVAVRVPVYRARLWRMLDKAAEVFNDLSLETKWGPPTPVLLPGIGVDGIMTVGHNGGAGKIKRERTTLRILLVDDNKTNLDILRMYCKKRKFSYETAVDGKQAVEVYDRELGAERRIEEVEEPGAVEEAAMQGEAEEGGVKLTTTEQTAEQSKLTEGGKGRITLVLMDLQMPVMDGAEATAKIRETESKRGASNCLIYMVTGQSSDEDKERSVKAGANGYYVKPLSLRALDDLIALHFPV